MDVWPHRQIIRGKPKHHLCRIKASGTVSINLRSELPSLSVPVRSCEHWTSETPVSVVSILLFSVQHFLQPNGYFLLRSSAIHNVSSIVFV